LLMLPGIGDRRAGVSIAAWDQYGETSRRDHESRAVQPPEDAVEDAKGRDRSRRHGATVVDAGALVGVVSMRDLVHAHGGPRVSVR
jgi:CBS domain-containing protein